MAINLIELKDYELIPAEEDDQAWAVRILSGDYVETVIRYGTISVKEENDQGILSFDFTIVSSPDPDLTSDNKELQQYVGDVLQAVIRDGIESGSVLTRDKENE